MVAIAHCTENALDNCVSGDLGEVKWVNEYKMIARIGRGAFAEVNLCEKEIGGVKERYVSSFRRLPAAYFNG